MILNSLGHSESFKTKSKIHFIFRGFSSISVRFGTDGHIDLESNFQRLKWLRRTQIRVWKWSLASVFKIFFFKIFSRPRQKGEKVELSSQLKTKVIFELPASFRVIWDQVKIFDFFRGKWSDFEPSVPQKNSLTKSCLELEMVSRHNFWTSSEPA